MTADDARREEFLPPTALESSVRALGADNVRYCFDYIMLPMRDGVRLATVVIRPRAEGRCPTLLVRTPYAVNSVPDQFKPMHTAQFKKNYVLIVQNERGSEWSEGDSGFLTSTTTSRPTSRTPTYSSSSWTSIRTVPPTTPPTAACGCATAKVSVSQPGSYPGRSATSASAA